MTLPFGSDGRAVSPVIGNVLLVGVVVILGATISVLALSFLGGLQAPAPQADFDARFTETGDVTLTHTAGDAIAPGSLFVRVADGTTTTSKWATLAGTTDDVTAGDAVTLSGLNGDETVRLVWETGDRSSVLRTFETRGITAPLSSASVTSATGFASTTSGFGAKAWQAIARAGDRSATGSEDELRLGPNVGTGFDDAAQRDWTSGETVPFTLTYDRSGSEEATLSVDGTTVAASTTPADYGPTGDTLGFTLGVDDTATQTVRIDDLRLNGLRLEDQSFQSGSRKRSAVLVSESSIADGFVLTGTVTFEWSGTAPENSEMQLNVEVEEDGT